jgi:hypothetical protein
MECHRCKVTVIECEGYNFHGKILCEDCYMYETNPPRGCDPLAVSSALSIRKQLGQSGCDGLTEQQQKIFGLIEAKEKITKDELVQRARSLGIKIEVLEQELAFFRHCELVRGARGEDGKVYLSKWQH